LALALVGVSACAAPGADSETVRERYSIEAPDLNNNERFGAVMHLQDGLLFVSDRSDSVAQPEGGSVRVYDIVTGEFQMLLTPPDLEPGDDFGEGIALAGDRLVIGSTSNDNYGNSSGTANYINLSTGAFRHRLAPTDLEASSRFGYGMGMADGVIAVGARGAVYIYDWDTCQLITKLTPPEGSNESFGGPLVIDDGLMAVSARTENNNQGAVHLYDLATLAHLRSFSVPGTLRFGESMDLQNGLLAAGNSRHEGVGAAFLFDAGTGELLSRFVSGEDDEDDYFGRKLSLGDDVLLVGAERASFDENRQGTVYAFDTSSYAFRYRLLPDQIGRSEEFGRSIVTDGNYAVVGGSGFEFGDSGRVTVFRLPDPSCAVDLNADGRIDFFDVAQFLAAYVTQSDSTDFNSDGSWDFYDVSLFLTQFQAGCDG
jgi:hypothetical protein